MTIHMTASPAVSPTFHGLARGIAMPTCAGIGAAECAM
jgi:hypothetical protein